MAHYVFEGRMLPEYIPLTLAYQPRVEVKDAETIPDTEFELTVTEGAIRVEATTRDQDASYSDSIFMYAQDLARTAAEVATIGDGVAYVAMLETVTMPDGEKRALVLADRRLASLMTVFPRYTCEDVFEQVATDISLARALSDVVVMLTWPHYAPIAAGRVAESILRMLTGGRSAAHWQEMQTTLRVDRAYLQLLTDRAVGPRHGHRERVDGETNRKLAERSWTLMNRYLAYRLGKEASLSPETFPVLLG